VVEEAERAGGTDGRILDVGCWAGEGAAAFAGRLPAWTVAGVDIVEGVLADAGRRGVEPVLVDLEEGALPFRDGVFDVLVCNQVLEHLKNVHAALSEAHRVLRDDGSLVVSVPNLASAHNRVMLLAGAQPSSIRVLGPHVRGFTLRAFVDYLEYNGLFDVRSVRGVGFYPFPLRWGGALLGRLLTPLCHTPVVVARKRRAGADAGDWRSWAEGSDLQTSFR